MDELTRRETEHLWPGVESEDLEQCPDGKENKRVYSHWRQFID